MKESQPGKVRIEIGAAADMLFTLGRAGKMGGSQGQAIHL